MEKHFEEWLGIVVDDLHEATSDDSASKAANKMTLNSI